MSLPIAEFSQVILDSVADGVFTVDREWRITSFNRAAERITGIPRDEALGRPCCEVFHASICETACALRETMQSGRPIVNKSIYIVNARGERMPVSISTALLKDAHGNVLGGVETFRDLSTEVALRRELAGQRGFADIVGQSPAMRRIFDLLPRIAESDSTVLIEGESGTGKELVARAIHSLSRRRKKPLVSVSCVTLPDTLLASELFGYVAGAFTDARRDKPGRFARAEGGTIFLDEIGDISPAMQAQLLRVIQEKEYEPLGATKPVKADVRVIAATNKDLKSLVEQGAFREDLYYRLNVVTLKLPPLRERREDIPLLVEHFIQRFNRLNGRDIRGLSEEAMRILMQHEYPGNVRQLENALEHAFVLCTGDRILPEHLPPDFRREGQPPALPTSGTLAEVERARILDALKRHGGSVAAAASELGIHRTTLWRKLKRYGAQD